jgi:hypothetical protein
MADQPTPEQAIGKLALAAMMNPPQAPPGEQLMQPSQLDAAARQSLQDIVSERLRRMLNFRRMFDQKRLGYYRQYLGQRDQALYPDNVTKRSNTAVPYPFSNVETIVSRVHDAFFNFWPWFDSKGRGANDDQSAEKMGYVLDQKLKQANFVKEFEDLVRNICIYGHGAIKVDWDWDYDYVITSQPIPLINPQTGQPAMNPTTGQPLIIGYKPVQTKVPRNRPKFTAIDVYDLLIDPDGGFVAHMCEKPWGTMLREMEQNPNLYYPDAMAELNARISQEKDANNIIVRMAEFWDETSGTYTIVTFGDDREAIAFKDARMANRAGASYSSFRRKVYGGKPIVLWHGPNPFLHKKAPILYTSYVKLPNEIYGIGAIEMIADLSESLNKFVNMVTDNWNLGINRRYAYDVTADIDHEALNGANVPGGKVGVTGDPSKVIMPLPFFTPQAGDYAIIDMYKGMIEMTSGVSDFYSKAVGGAQGNRTATGISNVINESNYRFKMFIRNLELDVLQPLLQMCCIMVQQFITDQEEVEITDAPPGIPKYATIRPEELLGSFDFDIVAANYASNKVVRQRNLLAFANLAGQSGYINERPALVEMAKIFEVRNAQSLLKTDQQLQQEQMASHQAQIEMMQLEAQKEAALMILQAKLQILVNENKPVAVKNPISGSTSFKRPNGKSVGQGAGGGKPRSGYKLEGPPQGAGMTSAIREFGQNMGMNSMGLEGLGETGAGE